MSATPADFNDLDSAEKWVTAFEEVRQRQILGCDVLGAGVPLGEARFEVVVRPTTPGVTVERPSVLRAIGAISIAALGGIISGVVVTTLLERRGAARRADHDLILPHERALTRRG